MTSPRNIPFVAREGCIGAGQTTLASGLKKKLEFEPILERVAWNPFLQDLYENPLAFRMQASRGYPNAASPWARK
jgi:deoxyadenosine/deoxycytidine kinase